MATSLLVVLRVGLCYRLEMIAHGQRSQASRRNLSWSTVKESISSKVLNKAINQSQRAVTDPAAASPSPSSLRSFGGRLPLESLPLLSLGYGSSSLDLSSSSSSLIIARRLLQRLMCLHLLSCFTSYL